MLHVAVDIFCPFFCKTRFLPFFCFKFDIIFVEVMRFCYEIMLQKFDRLRKFNI